jgi:hypothetical protein
MFQNLVCLPNISVGACPDLCSHPEAMPYISAPYYGLLFLQMALQELPQLYVVSVSGAPLQILLHSPLSIVLTFVSCTQV